MESVFCEVCGYDGSLRWLIRCKNSERCGQGRHLYCLDNVPETDDISALGAWGVLECGQCGQMAHEATPKVKGSVVGTRKGKQSVAATDKLSQHVEPAEPAGGSGEANNVEGQGATQAAGPAGNPFAQPHAQYEISVGDDEDNSHGISIECSLQRQKQDKQREKQDKQIPDNVPDPGHTVQPPSHNTTKGGSAGSAGKHAGLAQHFRRQLKGEGRHAQFIEVPLLGKRRHTANVPARLDTSRVHQDYNVFDDLSPMEYMESTGSGKRQAQQGTSVGPPAAVAPGVAGASRPGPAVNNLPAGLAEDLDLRASVAPAGLAGKIKASQGLPQLSASRSHNAGHTSARSARQAMQAPSFSISKAFGQGTAGPGPIANLPTTTYTTGLHTSGSGLLAEALPTIPSLGQSQPSNELSAQAKGRRLLWTANVPTQFDGPLQGQKALTFNMSAINPHSSMELLARQLLPKAVISVEDAVRKGYNWKLVSEVPPAIAAAHEYYKFEAPDETCLVMFLRYAFGAAADGFKNLLSTLQSTPAKFLALELTCLKTSPEHNLLSQDPVLERLLRAPSSNSPGQQGHADSHVYCLYFEPVSVPTDGGSTESAATKGLMCLTGSRHHIHLMSSWDPARISQRSILIQDLFPLTPQQRRTAKNKVKFYDEDDGTHEWSNRPQLQKERKMEKAQNIRSVLAAGNMEDADTEDGKVDNTTTTPEANSDDSLLPMFTKAVEPALQLLQQEAGGLPKEQAVIPPEAQPDINVATQGVPEELLHSEALHADEPGKFPALPVAQPQYVGAPGACTSGKDELSYSDMETDNNQALEALLATLSSARDIPSSSLSGLEQHGMPGYRLDVTWKVGCQGGAGAAAATCALPSVQDNAVMMQPDHGGHVVAAHTSQLAVSMDFDEKIGIHVHGQGSKTDLLQAACSHEVEVKGQQQFLSASPRRYGSPPGQGGTIRQVCVSPSVLMDANTEPQGVDTVSSTLQQWGFMEELPCQLDWRQLVPYTPPSGLGIGHHWSPEILTATGPSVALPVCQPDAADETACMWHSLLQPVIPLPTHNQPSSGSFPSGCGSKNPSAWCWNKIQLPVLQVPFMQESGQLGLSLRSNLPHLWPSLKAIPHMPLKGLCIWLVATKSELNKYKGIMKDAEEMLGVSWIKTHPDGKAPKDFSFHVVVLGQTALDKWSDLKSVIVKAIAVHPIEVYSAILVMQGLQLMARESKMGVDRSSTTPTLSTALHLVEKAQGAAAVECRQLYPQRVVVLLDAQGFLETPLEELTHLAGSLIKGSQAWGEPWSLQLRSSDIAKIRLGRESEHAGHRDLITQLLARAADGRFYSYAAQDQGAAAPASAPRLVEPLPSEAESSNSAGQGDWVVLLDAVRLMALFHPARLVVAAYSKQQQEEWQKQKIHGKEDMIPGRSLKNVLAGTVADVVTFLYHLTSKPED